MNGKLKQCLVVVQICILMVLVFISMSLVQIYSEQRHIFVTNLGFTPITQHLWRNREIIIFPFFIILVASWYYANKFEPSYATRGLLQLETDSLQKAVDPISLSSLQKRMMSPDITKLAVQKFLDKSIYQPEAEEEISRRMRHSVHFF